MLKCHHDVPFYLTFVKSTFFYYFILSKLTFTDEINLYLSLYQKLFQFEQHSKRIT